MQLKLSHLYNWLLANKLRLNISKTHFMVFHRAKHKNYKINIEINKVFIEQVKHTKFLGIVFDDNLNWSNHIPYINSQIAKGVGIICQAKKYFTTTTLINLYNAFKFLYLINCVEVWGNGLSIHLTPLVKLQNKILRIKNVHHHFTGQTNHLFFRVFSYGIQFYRILILMSLMLASSIYLQIFVIQWYCLSIWQIKLNFNDLWPIPIYRSTTMPCIQPTLTQYLCLLCFVMDMLC